jgi:hypothetical protein
VHDVFHRELLASVVIVIAETLFVVVAALVWTDVWSWLTECDRGPLGGNANGCSYTNLLSLLILPSLPWAVAAFRWERRLRAQRQQLE